MIEHKMPVTEDLFTTVSLAYKPPELGAWTCYLFGGGPVSSFNGITWRPEKHNVPNAFHRFMQRVCFGNVWIKDK